MRKIAVYLTIYFSETDKRVWTFSVLFISLLIFTNYYFCLNDIINTFGEAKQFGSWLGIFLAAFSFAYIVQAVLQRSTIFRRPRFLVLLLTGPLLFAWKMSQNISFHFTHDLVENDYWNQVIYWPFKLCVMIAGLLVVWRLMDRNQPFYGFHTHKFTARPYLQLLGLMVPLIAAACTQPDFLNVYPKFRSVPFLSTALAKGWHTLLYELSYGSDFISIELFFRGFLILAFTKWAGKGAILPMALFYCTIHFGKPLGECISSFFGGIVLGVITYHMQTIWGGLMVHLGIAWLMELGGYLALTLF